MRKHSVYEILCPCGEWLQPHFPALSCLACRRELVIRWPADFVPDEEPAPEPELAGCGAPGCGDDGPWR